MTILAIHIDAIVKPHNYAPVLDRWATEVADAAGGFMALPVGTTLGLLRARLSRYASAYDTIIIIGTEQTREQTIYVQTAAYVTGFRETMSAVVRDDWDSGAAVRGLDAVLRAALFGSEERVDLVIHGDTFFIEDVRRDALVHITQPVAVHRADPALGLIDAVLPAPEPQPF